ncbi:MAG: MarC family NAAT transporter [Planctomycetia bacterium]|jgi:multiple antibiotic resistance protein|nr:MarC family NAAT transporter [Planctomycetia bacterium]MCC7316385.1 MarC family NAAT transporter [Planctomycetota bacterium]OQY98496.1 MAG: stress protection protein MarC [Planctomycetes bacterium UTPLA1]
MILDFLIAVFGTYVGLLPIANPFSTAVVFIAITGRFTEAKAQDQAKRACIYMTIVLIVSLFAGALIMTFFGISIPALRIAGGLIVARIGLRMLNPEPDLPDASESRQRDGILRKPDLAFVPLAMPMLSGPGSIAVTIGMAAGVERIWEYGAIAIGIVLVALTSWFVLRSARRIIDLLGPAGLNALTRVMGFLLVCVGVQFIATGSIDMLSDEAMLAALIKAIHAVTQQ